MSGPADPADSLAERVVCSGPRVHLVLPGTGRAADCAAFYQDNAAHLEPWEPPRPAGFLRTETWRARLAAAHADHAAGRALRLWIRWRSSDRLVLLGTANLSNITGGPFMACNLGYALAESAQGRGVMSEALRALTDHAFRVLGLHRVQANHLPENSRSAALLRRLGFVREGLAQRYLFIDGAWRDHVLTSLTNPDPFCRPAAAGPPT